MCCGARKKRSLSAKGDASSRTAKSPCRDGMNRIQVLKVSTTDLDNIPVPRREAMDEDDPSEGGVHVP